jgi:hypothetical protein
MSQWYYAENGIKHGPVTSRQLKALAQVGTLSPGDTVWREGMRHWQPAARIKGLFPVVPSQIMGTIPPPLPVSTTGERLGPAAVVAKQLLDRESTFQTARHKFNWKLLIWGTVSMWALSMVVGGVVFVMHPDLRHLSFAKQNQAANNSGMGLSEDRVLGEGTVMGRIEATTEKHLDMKMIKERDDSDLRVYRLGKTAIEIRGPRDNVTGVYVRTPSSHLAEPQATLTQTSATICLVSTIFNPNREKGKVDYIAKWLTGETEKWAKNPRTPHHAEKAVDKLVVVANFSATDFEVQIRPRQ